MIGLKQGVVELCEHEVGWEEQAKETIKTLKKIFGHTANDVQHVGSTSIPHIKAKPIIDIAIAVHDFDDVKALFPKLEIAGFIHRPENDTPWQIFFLCNGQTTDTTTHHIHVVKSNSKEWQDYLNFRNYLNSHPSKAKDYENIKLQLMNQYKHDRLGYTNGKAEFIQDVLRQAVVDDLMGKIITVTVDRPLGSVHPTHDNIIYPVNYGYIKGVYAPDEEELDAYLLGISEPLTEFTGRVIAIIHRTNDIEDKLVVVPKGMMMSKEEIKQAVWFQEQYFDMEIEMKNLSI